MDITENFFDNVLKMFKHFRTNIYHFVNMPVERETYTWNLISYPFTVNAFHLQQLNSIGKKNTLISLSFKIRGSNLKIFKKNCDYDSFIWRVFYAYKMLVKFVKATKQMCGAVEKRLKQYIHTV